jgi:hypothetical protein
MLLHDLSADCPKAQVHLAIQGEANMPPGVIAAIGDAADVANKVAQIVQLLNEARSVVLKVENLTDHDFTYLNSHHVHGGFAADPSRVIPPDEVGIFGSVSDAGSIATGTQGFVSYTGFEVRVNISWTNPYWGSNSAQISVEGPRAGYYKATTFAGRGNRQAEIKYAVGPYPIEAVDLTDGAMARELDGDKVYVILGGAKIHLTSTAFLDEYGGWPALHVVAPGALADVTFIPNDGTLLRAGNPNIPVKQQKVYLIQGGQKHWIENGDRIAALGLIWDNVRDVPEESVNAIPGDGVA